MASKIYKSTTSFKPPQDKLPTGLKVSYSVSVDDSDNKGITKVYRNNADGTTVLIGEYPKRDPQSNTGNFIKNSNATTTEFNYFYANGNYIIKTHAAPLVTNGGGNPNQVLGTNFAQAPSAALSTNVSSETTPLPNDPESITNAEIESTKVRPKYGNYYYPETLRTKKDQDVIQFTALSYGGRDLTIDKSKSTKTSFESPGLGARRLTVIEGSVTLPIQPSITDTNTVQWGGEELNPLQAFGAAVSYGAQTNIASAAQQTMNTVEELALKKNTAGQNAANAFRIFLAGKAVGINGLLSRVGGGVLNPNLELLFQGPTLRPFNFTFRLSPRDEKEAEQVKNIIRFFKENMAVQNTPENLFLKAPNVFQIKYLLRGDKDHPSLNRIKRCALQSCSVDYTPDGSYMTFNDASATMTSYSISLQFQELEPVTSQDYTGTGPVASGFNAGVPYNEIGY